jgi:hypothetical protein
MDFDITIGKYRLKMVDSVKVKHSVEQLSDTATVTLPAMVEGKALEVESKLHAGDKVTVKLGYDGKLETEFEGYLKAINTDNGNLTLECEDAIYLFEDKVKDEELTNISLKSLLEQVAKQIDPSITVETEFEFTWDKFTIYRATARDVLKKVQDETKANIWFDGNTLHVQPQYAQASDRTVVFDFARNIESSNLKYRKASDKKVEVELTVNTPEGRKEKVTLGASGGKSIKREVFGMTVEQARKIAENEHTIWCYDGYEGSFTGWLIPFVEPGDAVKIIDTDYPAKEGTYYVTGTEVSFSKEGGKRTISLGRWLRK